MGGARFKIEPSMRGTGFLPRHPECAARSGFLPLPHPVVDSHLYFFLIEFNFNLFQVGAMESGSHPTMSHLPIILYSIL